MVVIPPSDSSPASEAARIALTDDAVLALLRQHFAGIDSMYLCPNIPGKKELAARAVHARHLPTDERVLALFDDTIFGSGDEGFVVTARRVCWKNSAGRPGMALWQHIHPDEMYAPNARKLVLGEGAIEIADEAVIDACEQAFHVLAFSARTPASSRSGIVVTDAAVDPDAKAGSDFPTFRPSRAPSCVPPLESEVVPRSNRNPGLAHATNADDEDEIPSSRRTG